jgi:hypothetical protein
MEAGRRGKELLTRVLWDIGLLALFLFKEKKFFILTIDITEEQ